LKVNREYDAARAVAREHYLITVHHLAGEPCSAAKERGKGMLSDVSFALVALNRIGDGIGDIRLE
jgi:hypothetical protein